MTAVFNAGTSRLEVASRGNPVYNSYYGTHRRKEGIYAKSKLRPNVPTQGELLQKKLKEWYNKFGKTPFAIPVTVALSCLVFYASVAYISGACLSNMLAPLFMLGMLWSIGIKDIKRLMAIGAVAIMLFALILCFFLVNNLQHLEPMALKSADGKTMTGTLEPWFGGPDTLFTYNLTIALDNDSAEVDSAHLLLYSLGTSGGDEINITMTFVDNYTDNSTTPETRYFNYTHSTYLDTPINQFVFRAEISGDWMDAGDVDSVGNAFYVQGPIYKDTWEVAKPLILSAIEYSFIYVFGPYAIIVAMIWWTRRARKSRQQQYEKWEKDHEAEEKQKPKAVSKVPSMASAMGKDEDTFVCSECGADVPADAEVCPKCGEKFD
jgi:ribosomal protein L40E